MGTVAPEPAVEGSQGAGADTTVPAARPSLQWPSVTRPLLLALADLLSLIAAGTLAVLLWAQPVRDQDPLLYLPAAPFALLVVLAYTQGRLYPGFGLGPVEIIRRYWLITISAFLALAALIFALKLENVYSRVTLVLALGLSLVLVPVLRGAWVRLFRRIPWWPEPVVLLSDHRHRDRTQKLLADWPSRDLRPVSALELRGADNDGRAADPDPAALEAAAEHARGGVRVALIDLDRRGAGPLIDRLRLLFPRVIVLRELRELPVEGVQVQNMGGVLGLEYSNNLLRRQSRWVKRALDLVVAPVALVLGSPILLAAVIAVRCKSPGPPIFVQEREGLHGRTIRVPKIRTMVVNAEQEMEQHLSRHPELRAEWENNYKLRNDPRLIPGVGRLLRRFSLDELPQLWSVIRGDMSLIGPRPFPTYHLAALSEQALLLRRQVRPGLTGLWQVTARGVADVAAQEAHDTYYIRNWSLWLDLYILARTIGPVVSGRGAH